MSYVHGLISSGTLVAIQLLNAVLLLLVPWTAERMLDRRLLPAESVSR